MAMNGKPILPNNPKAPAQTIGINNKADRQIKAAMRRIQNQVLALMNRTPKERVDTDQAGIIFNAEAVYKYMVTPAFLGQIPGEIGRIIEQQLLESGNYDWYMYEAVQASSDTGASTEIVNIQAQTTPAEYPIAVQSAIIAPPHQARVELAKARVFEEMQNLSSEMKTVLSRVLADGMENGDSPRVIARQIYDTIGLPQWNDGSDKASYARALKIARTEINKAHRRAKKGERQQGRQLGLNIGVMHLSALKSNTRKWHAQRHGWVGTEADEAAWYSKDGNEINCFTADTEVSGRFVGGSKAWYKGRMIKIVTASGNALTVTPNHPVMTQRGLVSAGEITEFDNLVACGRGVLNDGLLSGENASHETSNISGELYADKMHPLISEIYSSLVEFGHSFSRGVSAIDFHGDGEFIKKDVEVVLSDRVLVAARNSEGFEALDKLNFVKSDSVLSSGKRSFFESLYGVLSSSASLVSVFGDKFSFAFGKLCKSINVSFGSVSLFETVPFKPSGYGNSGKPNLFRYLLNTFTIKMGLINFINIKFVELSHRAGVYFDSVFNKNSFDGSVVYTKRISDTLSRLSSEVSFDNVVNVSEFDFSGHVYDLQEVSGLMIANGVIVSNCQCSELGVVLDENGKVKSENFLKQVDMQKAKYFSLQ